MGRVSAPQEDPCMMLRTTLVTFFAVLLVGDMLVRALPVADSGADNILDQLLNQNLVERRSRKQVAGHCVSKCVSCSKYVGMIAEKCIKGCIQKPATGDVNNSEVAAWTACESFLYR
ncbi:uncharacterized protein LOC119742164 [Patiria miniata]|uniref:Uncharacterized protein n=1 Tax=Patiria miniata TaxID=46514 RepID=A0A914BD21_PATMI|nr:uncharacterized protein LOC119742164 [Patiria miniata]